MAAGAGRRFGRPKALIDTGSGPWLLSTLSVMTACDEIVVVVGAEADQVAGLLPDAVRCVNNPDFEAGMGSSLRLGIEAAVAADAVAVLVMLVDLPDVTSAVVDRLVSQVRSSPTPAGVLARAAYHGRPGHPVLVGRDHLAGVLAGAVGDAGARDYLAGHHTELIECGDIGDGRDVDTPDQL